MVLFAEIENVLSEISKSCLTIAEIPGLCYIYYRPIGAVSGNGIIKINLLLHAFPVVTAKERNVIFIALRHRSVHDGHNCRGTTGQWS